MILEQELYIPVTKCFLSRIQNQTFKDIQNWRLHTLETDCHGITTMVLLCFSHNQHRMIEHTESIEP